MSEPAPEPDPEIGEVEDLLTRFQETGDPDLRSRAIELAVPLAAHLARRFEGRGEDRADLRQVAMVGLINAADRFDPERAGGFVPFAVATIMGELKRHFRDKTWAVRVPRSVKEKSLSIRAAMQKLEEQNLPITIAALVSETGLTEDDVLEGIEGYQARLAVSLDAPASGRPEESAALIDLIAHPDEGIDDTIDLASLRPALAALSARDRQLIDLRFVHDLSQSEIGQRLGVSQMQVSRLLRSVCERLRNELNAS
jgi:RNA polymerase sigma-B factor